MTKRIGIIRESKNKWERRAPLVPADVRSLLHELPVRIRVQPSPLRIFTDRRYAEAGAEIEAELSACDIILGIKEIKVRDLLREKVYLFFSHTIKGQDYNMPMLRRLMDLGCTLIDYEKIANDQGQRLIYFSLHAGLAGITETLWSYGRILKRQGIETPFSRFRQTLDYNDLNAIRKAFRDAGSDIRTNGLPREIRPLVIGITGYGNVARGVRELLDLLPCIEIDPGELSGIAKTADNNQIYVSVFKEEHMVEPLAAEGKFDLQEYYDHPEKYRSRFEAYLPHLTILINATYWAEQYPRHVTRDGLRKLHAAGKLGKFRVIGDISCDISGGVEITYKATDPGEPVFTYNPELDRFSDGFAENGITVMAVDNLPSELPKDASVYFSGVLKTQVPDLIKADYKAAFSELDLPPALKDAVIVHQGKLTPGYAYLEDYLEWDSG